MKHPSLALAALALMFAILPATNGERVHPATGATPVDVAAGVADAYLAARPAHESFDRLLAAVPR